MVKGQKFQSDFIVDEKIYRNFIKTFNDKNPLHIDDSYARQKGFKQKVMHGNILNGFLSYFVGELLPVKDVIIHSQEIRYNNPVYLGNKLKFMAQISDVFESVNVIEFKFQFRNEEQLKVAKGKIQIGIIE